MVYHKKPTFSVFKSFPQVLFFTQSTSLVGHACMCVVQICCYGLCVGQSPIGSSGPPEICYWHVRDVTQGSPNCHEECIQPWWWWVQKHWANTTQWWVCGSIVNKQQQGEVLMTCGTHNYRLSLTILADICVTPHGNVIKACTVNKDIRQFWLFGECSIARSGVIN